MLSLGMQLPGLCSHRSNFFFNVILDTYLEPCSSLCCVMADDFTAIRHVVFRRFLVHFMLNMAITQHKHFFLVHLIAPH